MLSISQFSKISHITTKALRYYDGIDLLKPAQVNQENGYRYYDIAQLRTVLFIQKLKEYECSLEEIKWALENQKDLKPLIEKKKIEIEKKMMGYSLLQLMMETDLTALAEGGDLMFNDEANEITVVENHEMNVCSIRRAIDVKEFGRVMNELVMKIDSEKLTIDGPPMSIFHSPEYTPENYDMEIAIPVLEETNHTRRFEPERSAKSTYIGKYNEMPKVYAQLAEWIEKNSFELGGSPFEIYLTDPFTTAPEKNEVAVYFPIRKKK